LGRGSKWVQELTGAVVEFIMHDLRPVHIVDYVGFLHLMEVIEPRYVMPCHHTITNSVDKLCASLRNAVEQELKDVQCLQITIDMSRWWLHIPYCPLYNTNFFQMVHRNLQSCPFPGNHTAINIAELLGKMADKWCIDISSQIIVVTTGNA